MESKFLTRIALYHGGITVLLTLAIFFWGSLYNAASCFAGSLLIGLNLLIMSWAWRRIFLKKTIALAISAIVIKYAILGLSIYILVLQNRVDVMSFMIGLGTLIPTVFALAIDYKSSVLDKK